MTFDWSAVSDNYDRLLEGAAMTVLLTALTMAIALPGGLALALLRMSGVPVLSSPATCVVEFFRATPLILQIYWAFYVLRRRSTLPYRRSAPPSSASASMSRPSTPRRFAPAYSRSGRGSGTRRWRSG